MARTAKKAKNPGEIHIEKKTGRAYTYVIGKNGERVRDKNGKLLKAYVKD